MPAISLYFQIHQPFRLRRYTVFDLGQNSVYEDDDHNCDTMLHAARVCYLPMNDLLLRCIQRHGKRFRVSFSISGTALDQFEQYTPEIMASFKALAATGCVEFIAETDNHSLAFLYSRKEFQRQVKLHCARIKALFGKTPTVLRNSELIYNNDVAAAAEEMGFTAIMAEGADQVLGWRSPNFVYQPVSCNKLKLLLRNYTLSDDIALRFSDQSWDQWPLTADTFASWCHAVNGIGETINLFMDYRTFGLRHPVHSGIFQFMEALPDAILANDAFYFRTPSEVAATCASMGRVDVPQYISWTDAERDLNVWLGNDMQKDAIHALYALENLALKSKDPVLARTWLRLQTSDHFAYMCTKLFTNEADIGRRNNPYGSPYDAYINYMNVLADFSLALESAQTATKNVKKSAVSTIAKPIAPPQEDSNVPRMLTPKNTQITANPKKAKVSQK